MAEPRRSVAQVEPGGEQLAGRIVPQALDVELVRLPGRQVLHDGAQVFTRDLDEQLLDRLERIAIRPLLGMASSKSDCDISATGRNFSDRR